MCTGLCETAYTDVYVSFVSASKSAERECQNCNSGRENSPGRLKHKGERLGGEAGYSAKLLGRCRNQNSDALNWHVPTHCKSAAAPETCTIVIWLAPKAPACGWGWLRAHALSVCAQSHTRVQPCLEHTAIVHSHVRNIIIIIITHTHTHTHTHTCTYSKCILRRPGKPTTPGPCTTCTSPWSIIPSTLPSVPAPTSNG
eukprot:scpid76262/ scgid32202/ 